MCHKWHYFNEKFLIYLNTSGFRTFKKHWVLGKYFFLKRFDKIELDEIN